MSTPNQSNSGDQRGLLIWYALAAALAVFTYWFALGSDHIPKNGDELPYAHITRLTAASGHLLPLQSQMERMRNTKPPLLFWQGISSTNWGKSWTLWRLRYPSVCYTLLTGWLVFLLGRKLSGNVTTGLLAFLIFLAFFSTYRYGRPFLTDSPVVFWLFLPFFILLYWRPASLESRLVVPLVLGIPIGIGLLYKSFALAAPVLAGLALWFWHERNHSIALCAKCDAWKLAVIACLAGAIFSLWFVLDPDPGAVWKEFVLGENVGKFDAKGQGYFSRLVWGGESVWLMLLGYPLNAGLLAFPVVAIFYVAYRNRSAMTEGEKLLWMWVLALLAVFTLPNQRSERYLLPAMPALGVLLALNWERIRRHFFRASLVAAGGLIGVLAYLSLRLQAGLPGTRLYPAAYWALLAGTGLLICAAVCVPRFVRPGLPVAAILVCLCFAGFMCPLDGPIGTYSDEVVRAVRGREVWVPVNFRAKEEGYRFLLPGADIRAYKYQPGLTVSNLSANYPLFAIRLPMNDETDIAGDNIIGRRFDLGSRHTSKQIMEMLEGRVYEHLFIKELLVEAVGSGTNSTREAEVRAKPTATASPN